MQLPAEAVSEHANSLLPIQGLWVGSNLGPLEQLSIKSFLDHGHPYHLYTYENITNVPEGTTIKDANEIIPFSKFFLCPKRAYTPFSDWFRWELLNKRGGYWMDTDMIALKPVIFNDEFVICFQSSTILNVACLKFPANHFMTRAMASRCRHPRKALPSIIIRLTQDLIYILQKRNKFTFKKQVEQILRIVKYILCLFIPTRRIQIAISGRLGSIGALEINAYDCQLKFTEGGDKILSHTKPSTSFYPVNAHNFLSLVDDTYQGIEQPFPNSYAVHLWTQMFHFGNTSKTESIHPESVTAKLMRKHGIELETES